MDLLLAYKQTGVRGGGQVEEGLGGWRWRRKKMCTKCTVNFFSKYSLSECCSVRHRIDGAKWEKTVGVHGRSARRWKEKCSPCWILRERSWENLSALRRESVSSIMLLWLGRRTTMSLIAIYFWVLSPPMEKVECSGFSWIWRVIFEFREFKIYGEGLRTSVEGLFRSGCSVGR